jgi:chain length determinant protein tyrosine kinase EpsG
VANISNIGIGTGAERSIGAVLIQAGRLKPEQAEQILRLQREQGLRFGDAAMQLGFLTQGDIDFALSRQFDYPYLQPGESNVSEDVIAAYRPFSPQVETLRGLRTQLMLRWFADGPVRKALAIVSEARKEGRSFIAANLAVVFSQLGERTLLIDGDLRNPSQHKLFGVDNRVGLSELLSGRAGIEAVQRIPSLLNLSVLPSGALPPNPQELLARPRFKELLHELAVDRDVILVDCPASADTADSQTIAQRTGAALIVARKGSARMKRVQALCDNLIQSRAVVVGAVLNDF